MNSVHRTTVTSFLCIVSVIRNTQIQDGQHIFGDLPEGDRRVEFINSILRFDAGQEVSLRRAPTDEP